jgi:hypothetical protein
MTLRLGVFALLLLSAGCVRIPVRVCSDGWPLRIIQDPQCPRGICGYTCAPGRWDPTTAKPDTPKG